MARCTSVAASSGGAATATVLWKSNASKMHCHPDSGENGRSVSIAKALLPAAGGFTTQEFSRES
jgi:hypothetical protein